MNRFLKILLPNIIICILVFGFYNQQEEKKRLGKIAASDHYNFISINECFMWISNNGDGSHTAANGFGFFWPGGDRGTNAVYRDGLIWGGIVKGVLQVGGNAHRIGLQGGKILDNGVAADTASERYRVFKIRKNWNEMPYGPERDAFEKDYYEWPVDDGAPWVDVDGDGKFTLNIDKPDFIGDEVLWCVSNDLNPNRTYSIAQGSPIGLEIQTTVFAFDKIGDLGDVVFKKYKIINKSGELISQMFLGYWSDPDLGDWYDDFTGCDSLLGLGYTYNANEIDRRYGSPPPALGYDLLQGPIVPGGTFDVAKFQGRLIEGYKNLPMTSFSTFIYSWYSLYKDPINRQQFYNYLQGKCWNGDYYHDPHTFEPTKFILAGDPAAGTGWYDGNWNLGPDDRRQLISTGPFEMAPGDTQEVVIGIIMARGTSARNSVTELKRKDFAVQSVFNADFQLSQEGPTQPNLHVLPQDRGVLLWWETNAESYDELDPLLLNSGVKDLTYTFEGYRIWQFRDADGTDPQLLEIFDRKNGLDVIRDYVEINGEVFKVPLFELPNEGIKRETKITYDVFADYEPLNNARPYYYGVTSFAYSPNSIPAFLESPHKIIEVFPGRDKIDYFSEYETGDVIIADQISGFGDGLIKFEIVDPTVFRDYDYEILISGSETDLSYSLINIADKDTILKNQKYFGNINLEPVIIDGFKFTVENTGRDSINAGITKYRIKKVEEIAGPAGEILDNPVDVERGFNSTGKWKIVAKGPNKNLIWQSPQNREGLGYNNYEIRFTGKSSYYLSGYAYSFTPIIKSDFLASDQLPFEIWDVGRDIKSAADDKRLTIKVLDLDRLDSTRAISDKLWTQLPDGDWEEIFAYEASFSAGSPPPESGKSEYTDHRFGALSFRGDIPDEGTIIRISTWIPLSEGDAFNIKLNASNFNDKSAAQNNLDKISVFPNPYFGSNSLERGSDQRFVRFTGLPLEVIVRIYGISGIFIKRIDKYDASPYLDWDLTNEEGNRVGSGIYLAHLEMPGIGTKILKLAVIQRKKFLNGF